MPHVAWRELSAASADAWMRIWARVLSNEASYTIRTPPQSLMLAQHAMFPAISKPPDLLCHVTRAAILVGECQVLLMASVPSTPGRSSSGGSRPCPLASVRSILRTRLRQERRAGGAVDV